MKYKIEKGDKGFRISKTEKQLMRETIKSKKTPTNKDIADMLEMILERFEE